jgi:predicted AlkP superfamily pyrophosphatase or phosphodiesterase
MISMQRLSLLHLAPTIAAYFELTLSTPLPPAERILTFLQARRPPVVLLLVIDSLDCALYRTFSAELAEIRTLLARGGLVFACETVSTATTPAIASMLTGLPPDSHGILTSEEVGTSQVHSILELLDEAGMPTAAVMETKGTQPLQGRISYVRPVDDREDIEEYDDLITSSTLALLRQQELRFIFAHLRTIDRFAHRGMNLQLAARITNHHIRVITEALGDRKGVLLLCGDHAAHLRERGISHQNAGVPLVVTAP